MLKRKVLKKIEIKQMARLFFWSYRWLTVTLLLTRRDVPTS